MAMATSEMEPQRDKLTKVVHQSVLDSFSSLTDNLDKRRIDSALTLIQHLVSKAENVSESCDSTECRYACGRLVRGLGSSREIARKGYYAALVVFLQQFSNYPFSSFMELMDKELAMGKFGSKGEEGEVCLGRILACGALIRSGRFAACSSEDQLNILKHMIEASTHKSYLPQVMSSFLTELLTPDHNDSFTSVLWPAFQTVVLKPWAEQTLDSLLLLVTLCHSFPKQVKKTELKSTLGAPKIVCDNNLERIHEVFLRYQGPWHRHPVYDLICKDLGAAPELAIIYWQTYVDAMLLTHKASRAKASLAIELFRLLAENLADKTKLPELLTPRFISLLRQRLMRPPIRDEIAEELRIETNESLVYLINALKAEDVPDLARASCLEKIVTASRGEFGFDQVTKSNVVHSIAGLLKSEGLSYVADLCRAVITGTSHPSKEDDEASNDSLPTTWLNKDRMAAIHLLASLAAHVTSEPEFRTNQLLLLLEYAFFPPPGCTSLCPAAKEGLLRCIAAASPRQTAQPLELMREQLTDVVSFISNKIANGQKPYKASKDLLDAWKKMASAVEKLKKITAPKKEQKSTDVSQKHLASVLLVLFMHLGIQLFLDAELAVDSLQELHLCVEKAGLTNQKLAVKTTENEPTWVEVVTELFLSLLSQSSSMLRGIVSKVFSAMCPLMTEPALLNLVNVLDCSSEVNPLSARSEQRQDNGDPEASSSDAEEEEGEEGNQSDGDDNSEEESEEELEEDEEVEKDTINDRLRASVREALGDTAEMTDTESIDVDDISEEEGERLNSALSQAFKVLQKAGLQRGKLTKKQSRDVKELVHFRVRVLDLIETYIQSEESLLLTLGLITPLFMALEACLKDANQKPLETRLRSCLKKLSNVKKFKVVDNVDMKLIANLLMTLIAKGERTAAVFLEISHEVCIISAFLVRCSQLLPGGEDEPNNAVTEVYTSALNDFFEKRDCLLPPAFFSAVLKANWRGNFLLYPLLLQAAFKSETVRPFRKTQAVSLLRDLITNKLLTAQQLQQKKEFCLALNKQAAKFLSSRVSSSEIETTLKNRFLKELLVLLTVTCQQNRQEISWDKLADALKNSSNLIRSQSSSQDVKRQLKKIQNILGINEEDLAPKPDFEFIKPQMVVNGGNKNGIEEANPGKKKRKRKEPHGGDNTSTDKPVGQEKSTKKKSKKLRLNALSDGLDESVGFSELQLDTSEF